jgi:EAL domain-containing protein (putative c-di-GMP-specific phosphodiesterase class I)
VHEAALAASGEFDVERDSCVALEQLIDPASLYVAFQPIIDLASGELFAYEALARCSAPECPGPQELFERAVENGCVGRLGRIVRELAVPLASGCPLFLNVHPRELEEGWLVRPDDPLFLHDHDVYLEITESVPLTHFDLCMSVLRELKSRAGVHLVVDDLGAGYSNLKSIADLEPRVVKLDRGLIAGLHRSSRKQKLVSGVVRICRDLDARVVAEGVETVDEYRALVDTGADLGQGFLFARPKYPMPAVTWPPRAANDEE